MALSFNGKIFEFTQPDGSKFKVRGWGSQHYAVFETLDGYTVVKDPSTGFFEIAQVSGDGTMLEPALASGRKGNLDGKRSRVQPGLRIGREAARAQGMEGALRMGGRRCDQRREERKNLIKAARMLDGAVMAPPKRATVGDFVGLCLLIDFSDDPGTIPREEIEKFCNEKGYSGFGNNGSVFDYFNDNSIGRCRYTNIVPDYYRAQHPKSYYTDPNIPQGTRARQLIVEALTHLKSNGFDFTPLTADGNGYLYATNVYYAGEVTNNWAQGLWPHAWCLAEPVLLAPGKSAYDYQFTSMGSQLSLGTFCHENGHMLCDYPDFYDYGYESSGVGNYCLMASGGDENNPVHISAYLKRLSGWAKSVTPIGHDQEITLAAGENDFAMFAKDSGEYFLIENRVKSGRDQSLPDEGLAIWHVDESGSNNHEQMTPSQHYELSLEQADGEFRLESTGGHGGDSTDLYGEANKRFADATTPNSKWWNGTASNLEIFDITAPGAAVSFKTKLSEGDSQTVRGESTPGLDIPDNQAGGITDTISIARNALIASAQVTLDISHTYVGDLRVTLQPPKGEAIVLHERQGGPADNIKRTISESEAPDLAKLHGHGTQGDWKLWIQDLAPGDAGALNRWALEFVAVEKSQGSIVLEEAPGAHIPDNDPAGIQRGLSTDAAGNVGGVEVSVNITHTWIGDLRISLRSPGGTEVVLHDRTGKSVDNIIKTYTAATTPELANLSGQSISGEWRLHVSDRVGQDVGKLNDWRLVIGLS
uniref:M6 family metalloprotease domain-containing protein n=1 Tax=Candidatus Kentrum sp. TC TaxID=2126339 RepID=A0A450ZSA0_9GAMM|nr:MAG: M6 family metalloprotease domain-containing protein [Candidatus Kentron sp. TC]